MTDRPILFSAPMVRALLDGRKTQTRRVMKVQPHPDIETKFPFGRVEHGYAHWRQFADKEMPRWMYTIKCPYGVVGDRLWVRETWTGTWAVDTCDMHVAYAADGSERFIVAPVDYVLPKAAVKPKNWVTPLFMPRWASRITLEITEVRVHRLQECSEGDAVAEGIYRNQEGRGGGWRSAEDQPTFGFAASAYRDLWESINGPGSWGANPWVWALTFKVVA